MSKKAGLQELNYGKRYEVIKAWSREPVEGVTTMNYSVEIGDILRFIGPNFDGAWFRCADKKKIVIPASVCFRILREHTADKSPSLSNRR